jgi:hypothetical protein
MPLRRLHHALLLVAAAALLPWPEPAAAQAPSPQPPAGAARQRQDRDMRVANETDRTVQQLFVFRVGTEEQGEDRLGTNVLPPRASLRVPLGRTANCNWEVRAVFEDGEELRRRANVCNAPRVVLTEAGPRREVEVANDAELELRELYVWAPGSGEESRDRLGSATVPPGETFALRLRGATARDCVVSLRAVFADDSVERRERVDLCRAPRIAFGDPDLPLRQVPVMNRARRTLRELYAAPALPAEERGEGRAWGPDRLGSSMIAPRESFALRVRGRGCAFDLRAVFEDDRAEVQRNVDLCVVQGVVFGERAAADAAPRRVTLVNRHGRTVQQAFLSPHESQDWGEDVLGAGVLRMGAQTEVGTESGCRADLRVVFDTNAAEERRDIDICAATTIVLRPGWTVADRMDGDAAGDKAPVPPGAGAATGAAPGTAAGATGGGAPPPGAGRIRLRNAAPLAVVELYVVAAGAESRGPDRLGAEILAAGASLDLAPPEGVVPAERCRADLIAVFRDGRELRLSAAELCAGPVVVLQ